MRAAEAKSTGIRRLAFSSTVVSPPDNAVINRDGAFVINRDGANMIADPTERT